MSSTTTIHSVQSLIEAPLLAQAPVVLDESLPAVKSGFDMVLGNLLGVLTRQSETAAGAQSLFRLVQDAAVNLDTLSTRLDSIFAGGPRTNALMQTGSSLLAGLLGHKVSAFNQSIGNLSGLRELSVASLSAMVAPFLFGVIKQAAVTGEPLSVTGLATMLQTQKASLSTHLSEAVFAALGLGSAALWIGRRVVTSAMGDMERGAGAVERTVVSGVKRSDDSSRPLKWSILALLLLALLGLWLLLRSHVDSSADSTVQIAPASGVSAASDPVPSGAGILANMFEGRPAVSVYFETGKPDLAPDFSDRIKDVLAYLQGNAAARASVSGFTDTTGDTTLNEALAKKRAAVVKDALVAAGVAPDRVSLDKPADSTGAGPDAQARRVEIHIVQ